MAYFGSCCRIGTGVHSFAARDVPIAQSVLYLVVESSVLCIFDDPLPVPVLECWKGSVPVR